MLKFLKKRQDTQNYKQVWDSQCKFCNRYIYIYWFNIEYFFSQFGIYGNYFLKLIGTSMRLTRSWRKKTKFDIVPDNARVHKILLGRPKANPQEGEDAPGNLNYNVQ